jgi:branched-chain amino acid transport system permease protein
MPEFQVIVNILITFALLLVLSFSFQITYSATKSFILSLPAIITLSAYLVYSLKHSLPFGVSILLSVIIVTALSVALEKYVYSRQRAESKSPISILVSSLGVYIILQNCVSILWGDQTKRIRTGEIRLGYQVFSAYITGVQVIIIMLAVIFFVAVLLVLQKTSLGRQIRAVSSNPELCNIYGINSTRVILYATAIGAALAAVAGILIAFEVSMTPTFGFNYFLYGVVAMIIGGVGSYRGLVFGSLLLAAAQHIAAYYADTKWMDASVYLILILFLIWKPLGFSGLRLKKVEV